jgi:hypothetical protein
VKVLVHIPGADAAGLVDRRVVHHGVVQHARTIAALVAERGQTVVAGGPADLTHTQFTDGLWGSDIGAAVSAFRSWAATTPRPLVVTLHDLPGADPDAARDARRGAGYARVITTSDRVIVSSRHEAAKVGRLGGDGVFIELPLALPAAPARSAGARWPGEATLGVLGFVYPGKGHAEMIEAAACVSPPPVVISLGAVSSGHAALHRQLRRHAARAGVRLMVTGPLSDSRLRVAAMTVTVPVMPNRRASASASLVTWIGCGRRPLAATSDYSRELEDRHPGSVELCDGDSWGEMVGRAMADPSRTRLDPLPVWPDVGAAHVEEYHRARAEMATTRAS